MFIELVLGGITGLLIGMITGLVPGIHVNLASAVAVTILSQMRILSPFFASALIVSMMISHNLFDFIPSVFLCAPDEEKTISVLPGHKMLLEGRGMEAVLYSILGSLAGLVFSAIIFIPFWLILPIIYGLSRAIVGFALIGVVCIMIFRESKNRAFAFILVILAGTLGFLTFALGVKDPLLSLLSGLFGISVLLGNFSVGSSIPPQLLDLPHFKIKPIVLPAFFGSLVGTMLNIFPGVGPSQASIISLSVLKVKRKEFVISTVNAVSTGSLFGSFVALSAIGKARNAPLASIQQLLQPTLSLVISLAIVAIITTLFCSILVLSLAPFFLKIIARFKYNQITIFILIVVIALVIIRSGLLGLLVLATGTLLGLAAHFEGAGKHHLMASLLLPTASYFLF